MSYISVIDKDVFAVREGASTLKMCGLSSLLVAHRFGSITRFVEAARLGKSLSSSAAVGLSVKTTCIDGPLGVPHGDVGDGSARFIDVL